MTKRTDKLRASKATTVPCVHFQFSDKPSTSCGYDLSLSGLKSTKTIGEVTCERCKIIDRMAKRHNQESVKPETNGEQAKADAIPKAAPVKEVIPPTPPGTKHPSSKDLPDCTITLNFVGGKCNAKIASMGADRTMVQVEAGSPDAALQKAVNKFFTDKK